MKSSSSLNLSSLSLSSCCVGRIPVVVPIIDDPDSVPSGIRLHDPSPVMVETRSGDLRRLEERFIAEFADSDGARDSDEFFNSADSDRRQEEIYTRDSTEFFKTADSDRRQEDPSAGLLRMEETIRKAMGDLFSRLDESNRRRDQANRTFVQTMKELRQQYKARFDSLVSHDEFSAPDVQNTALTAKLKAGNGGNSAAASIGLNARCHDRAQYLSARQSKVDSPIISVNDSNGFGTCITASNLLQTTASMAPANLQPKDNSVEESIAHFSAAEICNFIGSKFSNPMVELRSLKQVGMVSDYITHFKTLLEKVEINESYAVHLFVSGLKSHVQKSVKMFEPKSLVHAFALARLQESALNFRGSYCENEDKKEDSVRESILISLEFDEERSLGKEVCVEKNGGNDVLAADVSGVASSSSKKVTTDDVHDFKMNLEKILDGSVQVSGLTEAEESERTDELSSAATEDEVGNHSDNALQSKMKEGVDANTLTSVEEIEVPTIEEERHSTLDNDGLDAEQTSETKITSVKADITEEKIAEDVELVDEPVVKNEEDLAFTVVSSDNVIHSDGQIAFDEIDEDVDLNTDSTETKSNPDESDSVNDSMPSEISLVKNAAVPSFIKQPILSTPKRASTRRIRVSSDSDNLDIPEESTKSNDSMVFETSRSYEDDVSDWGEQATPGKDAAASLENSPTHQLTVFLENATAPSLTNQPTLLTPRRASDSAYKATSDNKENQNKISTVSENELLTQCNGVQLGCFQGNEEGKQIRKYLREGDSCQGFKFDINAYLGLLTLDFVEGFPLSQGISTIQAVGDRLSKDEQALSVAQALMSSCWSDFFTLQGVELHVSTACHPQLDGQTEMINRCWETCLRCMCGYKSASLGNSMADCSKLLHKRLFFKLPEVVLEFGNRMNGEIESAPHKTEEPKHRTERIFRVFKGMFQPFVEGNMQILNLEGKVN